MNKCDICQKETSNTSKIVTQMVYNPSLHDSFLTKIELPPYCDDCQGLIDMEEKDSKDMAQISKEWHEYRNEGLGQRG